MVPEMTSIMIHVPGAFVVRQEIGALYMDQLRIDYDLTRMSLHLLVQPGCVFYCRDWRFGFQIISR